VGSSRAEEAAGERERRENVGWKKKTWEKLLFWLILDPIFSSLGP
jgi:hypothetical protein